MMKHTKYQSSMPRLVRMGSQCSAMGGQDGCVKAQNVVTWEAQTSVLQLKM